MPAEPRFEALARSIRVGAAPVLQGIKASNLLCFTCHGENLEADWKLRGPDLARDLGLEFRILRRSSVSTQVLFFRPALVNSMLRAPERRHYLSNFGYSREASPTCVFEDFCQRCHGGVPHEVGCFLDYPVADVQGFIENQGRGGLFAGWWRVYADPVGARRQFQAIDEARRIWA